MGRGSYSRIQASEVATKVGHRVWLVALVKGTKVNKLAVTLLGTALFAGAAFAASDTQVEPANSGTYYWLHPKLGMVKVDRATKAMVVAKRDKERTTGSAPSTAPSR